MRRVIKRCFESRVRSYEFLEEYQKVLRILLQIEEFSGILKRINKYTGIELRGRLDKDKGWDPKTQVKRRDTVVTSECLFERGRVWDRSKRFDTVPDIGVDLWESVGESSLVTEKRDMGTIQYNKDDVRNFVT